MDCSQPGFPVQARMWSGLPFPSPGHLPDPRIKPGSPASQVDSLLSEPAGKPEKKRMGLTLMLLALMEERGHELRNRAASGSWNVCQLTTSKEMGTLVL